MQPWMLCFRERDPRGLTLYAKTQSTAVSWLDIACKMTWNSTNSSAVVPMMIGFGDDDCPLDETVDLVEVCPLYDALLWSISSTERCTYDFNMR